MSLSQLASGAAWNTMAKALQLLVTLLTLFVVGRYAGPEAFGVMALVWVGVGLLIYIPALAWLAPYSRQAALDVVTRMTRGERGAFRAYFVAVGARPQKISD